jgi:hypothetical protein
VFEKVVGSPSENQHSKNHSQDELYHRALRPLVIGITFFTSA